MTIWKFPILIEDSFKLSIPRGSTFLDVQVQHGEPQSWWLVDPHEPKETVELRVHGTGHPVSIAQPLKHLGTFQMHGGSLVFHLFVVWRVIA
jgi:hypothetical protein